MARREVELLIRARDQASRVANQITDSFDKLLKTQDQLADQGGETSAVFRRLASELAKLQTTAAGLGQFQQLSTQLDRASGSLAKLEAEFARTQVAFDQTARSAGTTAQAYAGFQRQAALSAAALRQQRASLAASETELARINAAVDKATNGFSQLRTTLRNAKTPSDELQLSFRTQRDAIIALVDQQERQKAIVADQKNTVAAAEQAFKALNREVTSAATSLERARKGFQNSEVATQAQAAALDAARANFTQLQQAAAQASAALGGVKTDQESITAASKATAQAIQSVSASLLEQRQLLATAGQSNLGGPAAQATAAFRAQIQAVNDTRAAWQAAQAEAARLGQAMRQTGANTAELRAQQIVAIESARRLKEQFEQSTASLERTRSGLQFVRTAFEPFTAAARANAQAQVQASQGAVTLSERLGRLIQSLLGTKSAADQASQSVAKLQAQGNRSFLARAFGVEENRVASRLQNLSFQINDIISGLASGQRPAQIFAQQIGQIGQLFPTFNNLLLALIRFIPVLAGIAAVLSPVVSAFIRLGEQARTTRQFEQALGELGATGRVTAQQLTATAQALDRYGLSLKDAIEVEKIFLEAGLNTENFEALGVTAERLAQTLGVSVPEAAKKLADAISGGARAALDFDRQARALTETERARLLAIANSTDATQELANAQEAAEIAQEAFIGRGNDLAENARGPWARAFRELGGVFNDLVKAIEDTGIIQSFGREMDKLAAETEAWIRGLRLGSAFIRHGFNVDAARQAVGETDAARAASAAALSPEEVARRQEERQARQDEFNASLERELASANRLAQAARRGAEALAEQEAIEQLITRVRREGVKVTQEQIDGARRLAIERVRARQAASDERRETAGLVNRQAAYNREIERSIAERDAEIDRLGETRREQAVMLALQQAQIRADQQRVTLTDALKTSIRESAEALFDAQQAEQLRLNILQQQIELRGLLNRQISSEQQIIEEAQLSNIDLTSQVGQEWANMRRQVIETTNAIKAARDQQELVTALAAQLRQGEREFRQAQQEGESQDELQQRLDALAALRDRLIQSRDAAIQMFEALGPGFADVVEQLKSVNTTLDTTRAQVLTIADANKLLADGLTSAFTSTAEAIAGAINNTKTWGEAFEEVGNAFRRFAADFLLRIAEMILQAQLLRAIQATPLGEIISGAVNQAGGVAQATAITTAGTAAATAVTTAGVTTATGITAAGTTAGISITTAGIQMSAAITLAGAEAAAAIAAAAGVEAAASVLHRGGRVGGSAPRRRVPAAVFARAARFHRGGMPGLRSNEVPAILERGERVVSRQDVARGGNGQGRAPVTINNLIDSGEFVSKGLGTPVGEQAVMNFISDNRQKIRSVLG